MPGMIKAESACLSQLSHSLLSLQSSSSGGGSPVVEHSPNSSLDGWVQLQPGRRQLRPEDRGLYLIQLLYSCANAVASNNMEYANVFLEQLSALASISGDPMQRVATYFMEGLAARITRVWPGLYKALYSTRLPSISDLAAARQIFFNVCPYLKFGFLTVNQAILDSMQGEKVVHVVDLEASDVVQWLALLQAFSIRPEGPPHLRITVVSEKKEMLIRMGQRLSETAEKLDIPFQFHPVAVNPRELERDMLGVKSGEAVAVTSLMQLHRLLSDQDITVRHTTCEVASKDVPSALGNAFERVENVGRRKREEGWLEDRYPKRRRRESTSTEVEKVCSDQSEMNSGVSSELGIGMFPLNNRAAAAAAAAAAAPSERRRRSTIEKILQVLHSLSPKIMVIVEQESNHNGKTLEERFPKALHYYSAMFDSLNSTLPQQSNERIALEKLLFGQEIRNIVACEGLERVERHEKLENWKKRFERAGFTPLHLTSSTSLQAERLLTSFTCDGYRLEQDKYSLTLRWQDTPMFSVSTWQS